MQERAGATHKVGTLLPSHVFFRRGATAQNPQGCDESCAGTDGGQGIIIVKWNRPINVGRVTWTRKLHSPSTLLLELWQH